MTELTPEEEEAARIREARRKAFCDLAIVMAGPRWQMPLAQPLGVSAGLLSHIAVGRRAVTDDLFQKLVTESEHVRARLAGRMAGIEYQAKAIKRTYLQSAAPSIAPVARTEADPDLDDDGPSPSM